MLTSGGRGADLPALETLFAPLETFDRVGLAVSGGPDSLALLVLAARWAAQRRGLALFVYTVDHGLRPEAAREAADVARAAADLGLPARRLVWSGPKPTSGLQAAARRARYRLMGEAMLADDAQILVTAHHMRDQAETVLMRLAHGSGVSGLGGIGQFARVEGVRICRPLLGVDPQSLTDVVAEAGLVAADDPSNRDPNYERVRWRQALPALSALGLDADRLARFAARAARADAALGTYAEEAFTRLASIDPFGAVTLDRAGLRAVPEEIAMRVVLRALGVAGGWRRPHALGQVEELAGDLISERFSGATLCGVIVRPHGLNTVEIVREVDRIARGAVVLPAGELVNWDGRFGISVAEARKDLSVSAGADLTRAGVERLLGPVAGDMIRIKAAPVVRDSVGEIVAVGTRVLGTGVRVEHLAAENG